MTDHVDVSGRDAVIPRDGAWVEPDPARPVPFWSSVRADVAAHFSPGHWEALSPWSRVRATAGVLLSAGFHVTCLYRTAHALRMRGGPPGAALSALIFWWMRHFYGCSIASTARLYGGVILPHPQGIVIGPGAVIGPRGWVFQNVTLGGAPAREGLPRVGADARIFAGAVLSGPIRVGDTCFIGANAVVSRDIPDRTFVRVPAAEFAPAPDRLFSD